MQIGLIGGTGDLGKGLALRWGINHTILVGSRELARAQLRSREYSHILRSRGIQPRISAGINSEIARNSELVVACIPEGGIHELIKLKPWIREKPLLCPIAPSKISSCQISIAEKIAAELENPRVVAGMHTIPALELADLDLKLDADVFICGDDAPSKQLFSRLLSEIPGLRVIDSGELSMARILECLTPWLLKISKLNNLRNPKLKLV